MELADIHYDRTVQQSIMSVTPMDQAVVVFSDIEENCDGQYKHGTRLAKFIEKHKLGAVLSMPPTQNPNSLHTLQVWMWQVDHTRLTEVRTQIMKSRRKPRIKKGGVRVEQPQ